jgi:hypothetical protein
MNYFNVDDREFFLGKELGKEKITLLNWIRYQDESGDATIIYDDHVQTIYKRDEDKYPFKITSNRGHTIISKEAYDEWKNKNICINDECETIEELDPEELRIEMFVKNTYEISVLTRLEEMIKKQKQRLSAFDN